MFSMHASSAKLVKGFRDVHLGELLGVPFQAASLLKVGAIVVLKVTFVCAMLWLVIMHFARYNVSSIILSYFNVGGAASWISSKAR